jgi:hypothetical protein
MIILISIASCLIPVSQEILAAPQRGHHSSVQTSVADKVTLRQDFIRILQAPRQYSILLFIIDIT